MGTDSKEEVGEIRAEEVEMEIFDSPDASSPSKKELRRKKREEKKQFKKMKKEDKGYKIVRKTTYPPISLSDEVKNKHEKLFAENYLRTSKYTPWNFIPKNLFEQFRRVTNMYFLLIVIIVSIPQVSPIVPWTSIAALVFVLLVAAINDGYQDWKRYKADVKVNNEPFYKIDRKTGERKKIPSKDIKVGDLLYLESDTAFPCDIVILSSGLEDGICYVETAQLDGETNLKEKKAHGLTYEMSEKELSEITGTLSCIPPNEVLEHFEGTIHLTNGKKAKASLGPKQLLLRGTVPRNTPWTVGIAAYCGNDTKLALNQRNPPSKFSSLDKKINKVVLGAFFIEVLLSIADAVLSRFWEANHRYSYLTAGEDIDANLEGLKNFFRYFVLLSWVIPISLMVSLEIVKFVQATFMEWDVNMALDPNDTEETGMKVRTNGLNDELALVKYIFSDKTGTLTENRMEFKKCSIRDHVFHSVMDGDVGRTFAKMQSDPSSASDAEREAFMDYLLVLSLCHTVIAEPNEAGELVYKATSPDEAALVKAAAQNGFVFKANTNKGMIVEINGKEQIYELLASLEFTSDRRRMSVLLRTPEKKVVLYSKGADSMMYTRLAPGDEEAKKKTLEDLELFSTEGLRTLVAGKKELTPEQFEKFFKAFTDASHSMEDRQKKIDALADDLETDLQLIGTTAIEDKLQQGVPEAIAYLLEAGINIWVITGDKQETAINIAKSSNLVKPTTSLFRLNAATSEEALTTLKDILTQAHHLKKIAVVTDGATLKHVLRDHQSAFLELVPFCSAVVCCRVTPKQKAKVVSMVKRNSKDITLAIGDGANDVSMIQEAHIGVGIFGKEGTQAARTSDYAIRQFSHLERLISVHGRYSLIRNSAIVHFSFYKNIAFAFAQFWYSFVNGYSGLTLFDDWILTFFNLIITPLPPLFVACFEKDISEETIRRNPKVLKEVQNGAYFSYATLSAWLMSAVWHSIVSFAVGLAVFWGRNNIVIGGQDGDLKVFQNTVQTCAIMIPITKFALEYITWNGFIFFGIYASILVYYFLLLIESFMISSIPQQYNIFVMIFKTPPLYFMTILSIVIALLPDFTVKYCHRTFFPDNWQIFQELEHKQGKSGQEEVSLSDLRVDEPAKRVRIETKH
eukprot:TRINITY_DN1464_c0_g1_i1.p1 TRINITY_DN1464_c0_g1~~TRINITY_DN1464_c0_g1_i1.p1  ORF type:complete len:1137 (+),score=375.62 TRINITY_DN1464_c0_g1_i1:221-3631(+)